jgi:uncharacterized protein (DUF1697 family)
LEIKISDQIQKQFGFEVPIIVLETEELKKIIENNPFVTDQIKNIFYLYITFLSPKPEQIDIINKNKHKEKNLL